MSTKIGLGPTRHPRRLHLGDLSLTLLDGGEFWLDGGAMFGIIPKPMWAKSVAVDEANRIPLAMTCTLAETGGKRILVETGSGPAGKYADKEQGFFRFGQYWILDSLAAIGVEPESIDLVILTHLHFDHAGGGTRVDHTDAEGQPVYRPTFPRAKYVVQRGEWDDAVTGHAVMTGTYRPENLAPLEAAGVLSFVHGEAEIAPGVRVRPLQGHTRHQQGVYFSGGGKTALLPADLIPTAAHLGLRHNMAYDLLPYENMQTKALILQEAAEKGHTLLFGQDPTATAWTLSSTGPGRFNATPVELPTT